MKKKKLKGLPKRILAFVLALLMVFSLIPLDASVMLAEDGENTPVTYTFTVEGTEDAAISDACIEFYTETGIEEENKIGAEGNYTLNEENGVYTVSIADDASISVTTGCHYVITAEGYKKTTGQLEENKSEYAIQLVKKDILALSFQDVIENTPVELTVGTPITKELLNGAEALSDELKAMISFESSNSSIASVNTVTGEVTAGETASDDLVTITATFAGNDDYESAVATYTIKVIDKKMQELTFDYFGLENVDGVTINSESNVIDFTTQHISDSAIGKVTITGAQGTLSYVSDNEDVVKVDTDGNLTIVGAGKNVTITVTAAETAEYAQVVVEYTIHVNKLNPKLTFDTTSESILPYYDAESGKYVVINGDSSFVPPFLSKAENASGQITYEIVENKSDVIKTETFNTTTGTFEFTYKVGEVVIRATYLEDENYEGQTIEYTLVVKNMEVPYGTVLVNDVVPVPGTWYNADITLTLSDGYALCPDTEISENSTWISEYTHDVEDDGEKEITIFVKEITSGYIGTYSFIYKRDTTPVSVGITQADTEKDLMDDILDFFSFIFGEEEEQVQKFDISVGESLSDIKNVSYYIHNYENNEKIEKIDPAVIENWTEITDLTDLDTSDADIDLGLDITEAGKKVIYIKVEDEAGNISYASTDGLIFDATAPEVELEMEEAVNGYYTEDVSITVNAEEKDVVSGIQSIIYSITSNNGENRTEGTLFTADTVDNSTTEEQLVSNTDALQNAITFTVDADTHDAEDVIVVVEVTDHAGNVTVVEKELKISAEPPILNVEHATENFVEQNGIKYYTSDHVLTAAITSREDLFYKDGFVISAKAVTVDGTDNVVEDEDYTLEWSQGATEDEHIVTITFHADAKYTDVSIAYTDKLNRNVVANEDVFAIDANGPFGEISIGENKWEAFLENITFGLWSNDEVEVSVAYKDTISSNQNIVAEYIKVSASEIKTLDQLKDSNLVWTAYTNPISVSEDESFVVYVKLTDEVGHVSYISSNGYIVDIDKDNDDIAITPTQNNSFSSTEEGTVYYHSDVELQINVTEDTSGIQKITYRVDCEGKAPLEPITLYEYKYNTETECFEEEQWNADAVVGRDEHTDLTNAFQDMITIDSTVFDSDDVVVTVELTDNVGNITTESYTVNILKEDGIADIAVSYVDDLTANKIVDDVAYYNNFRKAEVVISSRESVFETSNVVINILDNEGNPVDTSLYSVEYAEDFEQGDTHKATITFYGDMKYNFSVEYTDAIGDYKKTDTEVFVIDGNKPTGTIAINETTWSKFVELITFGLWSDSEVRVTATISDETSPAEPVEYIIVEDDKNLSKTDLDERTDWEVLPNEGITISNSQTFVVYVRLTDYAGNHDYISSDGYIVDLPEDDDNQIIITTDTEKVNGYYCSDVELDIVINEDEAGIQKVEYWITEDAKTVLYEYDKTNKTEFISNETAQLENSELTGLLMTFTDKVVIDSEINDSKDTVVTVAFTDYAGTVTEKKFALPIAMEIPKISVTYENDPDITGTDLDGIPHYQFVRKAKVVITSRNDLFDKNNVLLSVVPTKGIDLENTYNITWMDSTGNGEHTAYVTFWGNAQYEFSVEYTNAVDVSADVYETTFVIDDTDPEASITIEEQEWWSALLETLTFGFWNDDTVRVSASYSDVTSQIQKVEYIKTNNTTTLNEEQLNEIGWKEYTNAVEVKADETAVVYLKVTDYAGNDSIVSSKGVIVDQTESNIALTPMTAPTNDYYSADIPVKVVVKDIWDDMTSYSGIDTVKYWVSNNGMITQPVKTIYDFEETESLYEMLKTELVFDNNEVIILANEANNSDNVVLHVEVTDNAGNVKEKTLPVKVDITKPTISIEYEEDTPKTIINEYGLYDGKRTAEIVITERDSCFDEIAATEGIKIVVKDVKGNILTNTDYTISGWTHIGTGDTATHTATIWFNGDGYYDISVEYTDKAGNANETVIADEAQSPYKFVIDQKDADVTLIAGDTPNANGIYSNNINAVLKVDDGITTSGLQNVEYWITSNNIETEKKTIYEFDADAEEIKLEQLLSETILIDAKENNSCNVVLHVTVSDNVGRVIEKELIFDIDVDKPIVSVKFENNTPVNVLEDTGYYVDDRIAKITVLKRAEHFDAESFKNAIKITALDSQSMPVNDAYTICYENNSDEHTYIIKFIKDAQYTFSFDTYTDKSGWTCEADEIEYVEDLSVTPNHFVIDRANPVNASVSAMEHTWNSLLAEFVEWITFGLFTFDDVEVTVTAQDATSRVETAYYLSASAKPMTEAELKNLPEEEWIPCKDTFTIREEQRVSIYLRARDDANNTVYVNSEGVVIDKTQAGITLTPDTPHANGIYNEDFHVEISVDDTAITSGIKTVEYWVTSNGKETQRETLFTFTNIAPKQEDLVHYFNETITVHAEKNNSSNVVVHVKVTDNAGITNTVKTEVLDVDITNPTIEISYDNNTPQKVVAKKGYFNGKRIATVIVTERTNHFEVDKFIDAISIDAKNAAGEDIDKNMKPVITHVSSIESQDGIADKAKHTFTIKYESDANYTFAVAYKDKAERRNDEVIYAPGTVTPDEFTVDATKPVNVSVSTMEHTWSKLLAEFVEWITFGLFTFDDVEVAVTAQDATSSLETGYYLCSSAKSMTEAELENIPEEEWIPCKDKFTIREEQRMSIYLRAKDDAGNTVYVNSEGIVVDKAEAGITLTPDAPNANGIYNKDVNVNIEVDDSAITSGIKTVEYWVTSDGTETQRETLFTFTNTAPKQEELEQYFNETVTVIEEKNNSSNVVLYVQVTDNAGNVNTESTSLDIDTTKPVIEVKYDNNKPANEVDGYGYFTSSRTATIVVTERSNHFDKDAFMKGIFVTAVDVAGKAVDAAQPEIAYIGTKEGTTADGAEHIFTVTYTEDANYAFKVSYTDKADNANERVIFDSSSVSPESFTVDTTKPSGRVNAMEKTWDVLLKFLTFGLYTQDEVVVTAESADDTSATRMEYYITDKAEALTEEELEAIEESEWTSYSDKFAVSEEQRMSVYVRVTDMAGNVTYINSDGIVIDYSKADITLTPDEANTNHIYHGDVNVGIKVDDGKITSGIKKVEYWVTKDGSETQRETLYTFESNNPLQGELKQKFEKSILVDAEKNNSSHVVVNVEVTDNAGNVNKVSKELDIDITKPVIEISYDKNTTVNTINGHGYFTGNRTATIVVTERENHFDADALKKGIVVTAVDSKGEAVSGGMPEITFIGTTKGVAEDQDKHTFKVEYMADANYTFVISYTDKADWKNETVLFDTDSVSVESFTIDRGVPSGKVVLKDLGTWERLLEKITFGIYTAKDVAVSVEADDAISDVGIQYHISNAGKILTEEELSALKVTDWVDYTGEFKIFEEQRMSVYIKVTDDAKNVTYVNSDGVVLDKTHAGITLTPDEPNANGMYNENVNVKIEVDDSSITSGIKTVEYWVTSDGTETQRETLFTFTNNNPQQEDLVQYFNETVTVDAEKNNSSHVVVYVQVTDNAGNANTVSKELDIDITKPMIEVSYDNNTPVHTLNGKGYYTNTRIATIVVTERTNHFDKDVLQNNIAVTATDAVGNNVEIAMPKITFVGTEEGSDEDTAKHTFTVEYKVNANYTFEVSYIDKADNANENVIFESKTDSPQKFTIDTVNPSGKITVGKLGFWETLLQAVTFGLWSPETVGVTIDSRDTISPIISVEYYKSSDIEIMTLDQVKAVTEWTEYDAFDISNSERVVVYAKITDAAKNVEYICTNGIIVDKNKPVIESIAPEITITPQKPVNGIYTNDVAVDVTVVDPKDVETDTYAGLNRIHYEIYNMGVKTQEGVLYQFDVVSPTHDQLKQSWNGKDIIVDAELNNSNDVVIKVIAFDNAGNRAERSEQIKIDITHPAIAVSYDNNNGDTTFGDSVYYNSNRMATVTVTERNFDASQVNVTITNTDGAIPLISNWTTVSTGSGNGDNAVHTATILYSADGDYTFDISCADLGGNANTTVDFGSSQAPTEFTLDKTVPVISIAYDNNDVQNGSYYKTDRVATITIYEHNFDASRVVAMITATDNGQPVTAPVISNWSHVGDVNTATVTYASDALYTFDIAYTDKAGNEAGDFAPQSFYVDKTNPQISITEIVDQSANNADKIGFVITATDTNFDVFTPIVTAVIKTETGFVTQELNIASVSNIANGRVYTINNIDADGIYRITCTLIDKAGNAYSEVTLQQTDGSHYVENRTAADTLLTFSVNRDGSTFEVDEVTNNVLNHYYVYDVKEDIVIAEVNANRLTNHTVTLNGSKLVEGTDYTVTPEGGNGAWMRYIYTINKSLFQSEGEYTIVVSSVDEATNNAFSDVKNTKVSFVVDRTAPVVTITGMENNGRYQTNLQEVVLIPTDDGGAIGSLTVYFADKDGNIIEDKTIDLSGEELTEKLELNDGKIIFTLEQGTYRYIEIICRDCSIRENGETNGEPIRIENVMVSDDAFALFWADYQYAVMGGMAVCVAIPVVAILLRKKKSKTVG